MPALTLDQAKEFLRYESDDDGQEDTLTRALAAAQEWVEAYTGLLLTKREVVEPIKTLAGAPVLLSGPVSVAGDDVIAVNYVGSDGAAASVAGRFVATDRYGRGSLWPEVGNPWPIVDPDGGVMVTYQAGYAAPEDVPQGLLEAMLVYAGMQDEGRNGGISAEQWTALANVIAPYQRPGLA